MIGFIVHLKVPPENGGAIEALLGQVREQTLRNEPGVAWYWFGKSADVADTYVVVEMYRDAAAHAAHMQTEWVKASTPVSLRLTGGAIEVRQYVSPGTEPAIRQFKEA